MAIPFTCPYCQHYTLIEEQFVGQSGPCVNCGKTVTVPPLGKQGIVSTESRYFLSPGALAVIGLGALLFFAGLCVFTSFFAFFL